MLTQSHYKIYIPKKFAYFFIPTKRQKSEMKREIQQIFAAGVKNEKKILSYVEVKKTQYEVTL